MGDYGRKRAKKEAKPKKVIMKIGIPREVHAGEKRVATTPDVAGQLLKLGFSVAIEAGAGDPASYGDSAPRCIRPWASMNWNCCTKVRY